MMRPGLQGTMNKISEVLDGVKSIGITGHIRPDGDCVGSTLGMYMYLKKICDSDVIIDVILDDPPKIFIVEPETVACIYQSAAAGDGCIHPVGGDPQTIMAGLNCGTPCSITWPVLRDGATGYLACTDAVSESGMRAYHDPTGGDPAVVSGESGAATYGTLLEVLGDSELRGLCGLGSDSVVLLISTEGDTDPEGYARVVEMKEERYNSTNHSY